MKTYKLLIMLLLCSGAFFTSYGQPFYFNKVWEKDYGGYDNETIDGTNLILLDNDSNIIVIGTSASTISGNKTIANCGVDTTNKYDIWLLKLHPDGNKYYENTYGGLQWDWAVSGLINPDGSIIIGGASDSHISCAKSEDRFGNNLDCWVIKIDSTGQKVWDHRYGTNGDEFIYTIRKGNNDNFVLIGFSYGNFTGGNVTDTSHGNSDILLFNIDSTGGIIWDRFYGSSIDENGTGIIDLNNNIVLAGRTNCLAPGNGDVSTGGYDTSNIAGDDNWIVKIDPTGNKIWDKRYGCYSGDHTSAIMQNSNGEYVISAVITDSCIGGDVTDTIHRGSIDIWAYRIDSANGNIITDKRVGGDGFDLCYQIIQLSDEGYLFAGLSNSNSGFDKTENAYNAAYKDFWLVRTDSNFNILWDKTIGGMWDEYAPNVIILNDSTFIIAGTTFSGVGFDKQVPLFDTASSPGSVKSDIWISKWVVTTVDGISEYAMPQFSLYPNPAKDAVYLTFRKTIATPAAIKILDMQGRIVQQQPVALKNGTTLPVNVAALLPGVYMISVNNTVQRFVKL